MKLQPYEPEIRFADIDSVGHVNNAVYFSYFEQARMNLFAQLVGEKWNWKEHGILVAHNEIDYKIPIFLRDKVWIEVKCNHIGKKSFTFAYEVFKKSESGPRLCSTGASVLVCFDHLNQITAPVPKEWISAFERIKS